jgi:hypothetical protein
LKTGIKLLGMCIIVLSITLLAVTLNFGKATTHGEYTVVPGSGLPLVPYLSEASQDAPVVSFWQLPS